MDDKYPHKLHFAGYNFISGPHGTIIKRNLINTKNTHDYGADPLGNGTFKMIPSGDIVNFEERNKRLAELHK